ncbi:MAG: glycosyltransferase [Candidatus Eisenbacteria bacterium]
MTPGRAQRPVTVLQTCFSPSWGGLEMQALDVSRRLVARGHRLTLACASGTRLAAEAAGAGLERLELDVHGYLHLGAAWRLAGRIRTGGVQIVHSQHSRDLATVVPALAMAGSRAPLLLSKRMGSYVAKKDPYHQMLYARVAMVLAISEVIRRNVIDTTPVPPARVATLHDAVDARRFSPAAVDRAAARRALGATGDELWVGMVGRFSPGKGHEEFLEAAARLKRTDPTVRFAIVGEASHGEAGYERDIRARAAELSLDDTVRFAGFRPDVPEVMRALDILAFPSHAEAFGVVLIEAMAMELPVVSTNCDGVLDIVVDGETGLFVPPRDGAALAAGLARLIADPLARARMGRAGRRRVLERFDEDHQTLAIERFYDTALGRTPLPVADPAGTVA